MPALRRNIIIEQGADFILPLQVYSDAAKTLLRDLTGYSVRMQIRRAYDSATAIFDKSSADAEIVIDAETGIIQITIPAAQTAAMPANFQGQYDIELVGPVSTVERLMQGEVRVDPETTR